MYALLAKSEEALVGLARGIMLADPDESRAMGDVVFWFKSMALKPGEHLFESNLTLDFSCGWPSTELPLQVPYRECANNHEPDFRVAPPT
jgi:hypothetical protein